MAKNPAKSHLFFPFWNGKKVNIPDPTARGKLNSTSRRLIIRVFFSWEVVFSKNPLETGIDPDVQYRASSDPIQNRIEADPRSKGRQTRIMDLSDVGSISTCAVNRLKLRECRRGLVIICERQLPHLCGNM